MRVLSGLFKEKFDERFNDLMSSKVNYGHCDTSQTGLNASLGQWCSEMRSSYETIQNNQKPNMRLHIHLSNGCEICFEMAYTRSRDKKFLHEEMRNACYLKDKMKHAKRK